MGAHSDDARERPGGNLPKFESGADQDSEGRLALARSRFEPLRGFLDRMGDLISKEFEEAAVLEQSGEMQPTAQNAHQIRYTLRHADEARLSLTFIMTGDNADLVLLQGHERSTPRDLSINPGQLDQHAYRLDEIDELKEAVREKIVAHLAGRYPDRTVTLPD